MAIYSETYGFVLTINTGVDLTSTTDLILRLKTPSGTVDKVLTTAHMLEPKTAGKIAYTVQEGDFPVGGKYLMQIFDVTSGRRLASSIITLNVTASLVK